jgi:hypothetical protein
MRPPLAFWYWKQGLVEQSLLLPEHVIRVQASDIVGMEGVLKEIAKMIRLSILLSAIYSTEQYSLVLTSSEPFSQAGPLVTSQASEQKSLNT